MPLRPPRIVPFAPEHLDDAARLLAARQARMIALEPDLPRRFADPPAARPLLERALAGDGAHGLVAIDANGLAGYLVGHPRIDVPWGRAAWADLAGHAVNPASVDLARDLYHGWAEHWAARGIVDHYVHVPEAEAESLATWFDLGFGRMQAYALRSVDTADLPPAPPGLTIRRAGPEDLDGAEMLGRLLPEHQMASPTFAWTAPQRLEGYRAAYAAELGDPGAFFWIALDETDGRTLGLAGFYVAEPSLAVPDGAWELSVAATAPDARERGLATALLRTGLDAARAAGATSCICDWRTANLLAARTWRRLGFRVTHARLHRRIDERVVAALGGPAEA